MDGLISIILPVYNREALIEECIRSVLNQTYPHFEILVIDDGSTDATPERCRALAAQDNRIHLLSGAHAGVSAARNKGLDAAKGEYLFFLDSDDVIHPRLLETLVHGARTHGAAISASPVVNLASQDWHKVRTSIQKDQRPATITYLDSKQALEALMTTTCALSMIGGILFRRDLVGTTRFRTEFHIGEDFFFIYDNLTKGADATVIDRNWYYGRLHDTNSSWDYDYTGFYSRFLRRQLVWEQEEALGRTVFADAQKRGAFSVYLRCQSRHRILSPACKQMRRVLRQHSKALLRAQPLRGKIHFLLAVYLPPLHRMLHHN